MFSGGNYFQTRRGNVDDGPLLISRLGRVLGKFTISYEMIYRLHWRGNLLKSSFIAVRVTVVYDRMPSSTFVRRTSDCVRAGNQFKTRGPIDKTSK